MVTLKLSAKQILAYLRFLYPGLLGEEFEQRLKKWQDKKAADLEQNFVFLEEDKVTIAIFYNHFHEGIYHMKFPTSTQTSTKISQGQVSTLVKECLHELKLKEATRIDCRIHPLPALQEPLKKLGFKHQNTRMEFKTLVKDLPQEEKSPFTWASVGVEGQYNLSFAAKILEVAGTGDPDWNAEEDNFALLISYVNDPSFIPHPDSIQIGFIDTKPAAIIIAQVEKGSGWSRITYMGMVPEFRKKGLGVALHRHGFSMMRAQGGIEYQGGTLVENEAMIRLFKKNQCQEFQRLEEWVYNF